MNRLVDRRAALRSLTRMLSIDGPSGRDGAVAECIADELISMGVPRSAIKVDRANRNFPFDADTGNVIVRVPGRGSLRGDAPRMFSAHMDTVALASGAKPRTRGGRIVPAGKTALGADDRSGVAAVLAIVRTLVRGTMDHPPLVLIFTTCEETGLWGSRFIDPRIPAKCRFGFNFDGGSPGEMVVAAPSQDRIEIVVDGIASHAGVAASKGASAISAFSRAVARLDDGGWLGEVVKGRNRGTSNIGVVHGGIASNIVTQQVVAEAEARSYSDSFLKRIVGAFRKEFAAAASKTRNAAGRKAASTITVSRLYNTFDLGDSSPVVRETIAAIEAVHVKPVLKRQFGGLDANWFNAHGLPTITLGSGQHSPHGTDEYLDIDEFLTGCEIGVRVSGADIG